MSPKSVWETCCAVCYAGTGSTKKGKESRLPCFLPGLYSSCLNGTQRGSEGQRNTTIALVSVTVLIYWVNFFPKREDVWVVREAGQTGLG